MKSKVIAVGFDGTMVVHQSPAIGNEVPYAVATLREAIDAGHRVILWTMRSGDRLQEAIDWMTSKGITLEGVNVNPQQHTWTDSPKVYAHVYIDDAAVGCPLVHSFDGNRPHVDWRAVREIVDALGFFDKEERSE